MPFCLDHYPLEPRWGESLFLIWTFIKVSSKFCLNGTINQFNEKKYFWGFFLTFLAIFRNLVLKLNCWYFDNICGIRTQKRKYFSNSGHISSTPQLYTSHIPHEIDYKLHPNYKNNVLLHFCHRIQFNLKFFGKVKLINCVLVTLLFYFKFVSFQKTIKLL